MKQTAIDWLMDEAMKLVVQYMQGTLNYDTLDDVIYELGTKSKAMEKEQIINAANTLLYRGTGPGDMWAEEYYNETFK